MKRVFHSRYWPATDARFTYRGEDVILTLERICKGTGYAKTIRVDNGSEFIARDLDFWAYANDVTLDFSRPGKPTDNGFILRRSNRFTGSIACPSSPSTATCGPSA